MVPNVALVHQFSKKFFGIAEVSKIYLLSRQNKKIFIEKYPNLNNDDSCLLRYENYF
jgi:hypothetical protein